MRTERGVCVCVCVYKCLVGTSFPYWFSITCVLVYIKLFFCFIDYAKAFDKEEIESKIVTVFHIEKHLRYIQKY